MLELKLKIPFSRIQLATFRLSWTSLYLNIARTHSCLWIHPFVEFRIAFRSDVLFCITQYSPSAAFMSHSRCAILRLVLIHSAPNLVAFLYTDTNWIACALTRYKCRAILRSHASNREMSAINIFRRLRARARVCVLRMRMTCSPFCKCWQPGALRRIIQPSSRHLQSRTTFHHLTEEEVKNRTFCCRSPYCVGGTQSVSIDQVRRCVTHEYWAHTQSANTPQLQHSPSLRHSRARYRNSIGSIGFAQIEYSNIF